MGQGFNFFPPSSEWDGLDYACMLVSNIIQFWLRLGLLGFKVVGYGSAATTLTYLLENATICLTSCLNSEDTDILVSGIGLGVDAIWVGARSAFLWIDTSI